MGLSRWTTVAIVIGLFAASGGREIKVKHVDGNPIFNDTLAKILVEYASAVYTSDLTALFTWTCSRCNNKTQGFEMIELIVDVQNCLQAFVGVAPDLNSIVIAFRGTQKHSIRNWIEDLFWEQLDLNYPGMPEAMVHHGFYSAYHNTTLRSGILSAIQRTRKFYRSIQIMVTGHSMGGALAAFCALDLAVNYGVQDIQLVTFGQPRIGNAVFASYFNSYVPKAVRVTNGNDIVPHLPPYYSYFPRKTYHHFPREVWLHETEEGSQVSLDEKICDDSGEDPSCSMSVYGDSIGDHLKYYGIELHADTSSPCNFIIHQEIAEYDRGLSGNIVLSRNPNVQLLVETS